MLSFVDRDMMMRFIGGGIGHRGAAVRREAVYEDEDDIVDTTEDGQSNRPPNEETSLLTRVEGNLDEAIEFDTGDEAVASDTRYDDGEEDYGYEASDADSDEHEGGHDEDEEDALIIDELGAEDGEEHGDMDEEIGDTEGYAPL